MSKTFTREEVARHNKPNDCWIIVDSVVYDVTSFAGMHPGGERLITDLAGKDVTEEFYAFHRHEVMQKFGPKLKIGVVANEQPKVVVTQPGTYTAVPYGESSAWNGLKSAYYNESHHRFRKAVREFMDREVMPLAVELGDSDAAPTADLYKKMGQFGIWASRIGPGPHLKGLGINLPGGVKPEEFDYFHELIAHEEIARLGSPSFSDGLGAGLVIGLPPVLVFAKPALKNKVVPECLLGTKRICLAISEPAAGSDVANIQCTAVKSADGKHYIVNGVKKWITNGTFCDYFTTAVRTGGPGMGGISMLHIERSEGLRTKPIKTSYSGSAGTSYIIYENVKVPVENLLGAENQGFKVIMFNFNHERWLIICGVVRFTRLAVEECFKWAHQRKVFNKPLIEQPVIRNKLAQMVAQTEAVQNWLENITYQMTKMSYKEQSENLAGVIALCKLQATRTAEFVADQAAQIFGGRAITKTGMGRIIEGFQRTVKYGAILGGSEEIMADLGVRQAMKKMPKAKL